MPYRKSDIHPEAKSAAMGKVSEEAGLPVTPRPYHLAKMISEAGDISPLCATEPRKLDLKVELWTNRREAVTCAKCLARMQVIK